MTSQNLASIEAPPGRRFRRALIAILAGCAAVLAVVLWPGPHPPQSAPREVAISDLRLRDGRWFLPEEPEPFSGIIFERYPGGELKSRSQVRQGLLEGVSEGWHTNGQRQITEHFHAGVAHGLRTKWYPNGGKLSEAMVVEGKLDGSFRRWSEEGTLSEEVEMKDGNPDGLARSYYPSGCMKAEVRLREGVVLERKFWQDGESSM